MSDTPGERRRIAWRALASAGAFLFVSSWCYVIAAAVRRFIGQPSERQADFASVADALEDADFAGAARALHEALLSDLGVAALMLALSSALIVGVVSFMRGVDFAALFQEAQPAKPEAEPKAAEAPRERIVVHLVYAGLGVALVAVGVLASYVAPNVLGGAGAEGTYGLMQTAGLALVALGVSVIMYRVLEAADLGSVFKLGGAALAGVSVFAALGEQSQRFSEAVSGPALLSISVELAEPADLLAPVISSAGEAPADQVFDIFAFDARFAQPAQASQAGFFDRQTGKIYILPYAIDREAKTVSGTIDRRLISAALLTSAQRRSLRQEFCIEPEGAWGPAPAVTLSCRFGGACALGPEPGAARLCGQAANALDWLAPPAHAQTPDQAAAQAAAGEQVGWAIPDLAGACEAHRLRGETFNRFDLEVKLPAALAETARALSYSAAINGAPLFINGRDREIPSTPVNEGAATITLALQNLNYSGAAGERGGRELLEISATPLGADGAALREPYRFPYQFTAMRNLPDEAGELGGASYRWHGLYVLGRQSDGQQMFVHSADSQGVDLRASGRDFDALGLVYRGPLARFDGRPVVSIVRPEWRSSPPGLGLAIRLPDGRYEFSFSREEVAAIGAWYAQARAAAANAAFRRFAAEPYLRPLVGEGAASAADAGCRL